MSMARVVAILALTCATVSAQAPAPGADKGSPPDAEAAALELLRRAEAGLTPRRSLQWNLKLEISEGLEKDFLPPEAADHPILDLLASGEQACAFTVRGPARVHWREKRASRARSSERECWYEGFSLYSRAKGSAELKEEKFYEGEGTCLTRSIVLGGLVAWRLSHLFDATLVPGKCRVVKDEVLAGRPCVVVEHEFKIGGICGVYKGFPGCRVWIDRERLVPLRREYAIQIQNGEKSSPFRAVETYSNWRLDEQIPDSTFHVSGMGPPDPIGDLPSDPDEFERIQTEKALGIPTKVLEGLQGSEDFDELPLDAPPFQLDLEERVAMGPSPGFISEGRSIVLARAPDGTTIEAHCTDDADDEDEGILPDPRFKSGRTNRRHRDAPGESDVYVGRREHGKLKPSLFFRDIGSHETAPHHVTVDDAGRVHLIVADVDIGNANRLKLYWVVGDLATGKWVESWLVDHRREFTLSSHPWSGTWKKNVHVLWTWEATHSSRTAGRSGIFHVARNGSRFGRKVRVARDGAAEMAAALDPDSGRLLLVWSTEEGVLAATKPEGGGWTQPALLEPSFSTRREVLALPGGNGSFMVRTGNAPIREWIVTPR